MTALDNVESWTAKLGSSLIGLGVASEGKIKSWSLKSPVGLLVSLSFILLYPVWRATYNIYFHPLSSYPGPRFAAATKIPIAVISWKGDMAHWILSLHEHYRSDIVRTSPDEVSVISASAWKDLYGHRQGHTSFPRDLGLMPGVDNIMTANDADHSRQRRLLSPGFSDMALREQEPLLMSYVDKLMSGLHRQINGTAKGKVDLSKWFMWTTFDLIGDLSFGRSFDCLTNEGNHYWVTTMIQAIQASVFLSVTLRFPPMAKLLLYCVPKSAQKVRHDLEQFAIDRVDRRLETKTSRPDFLQYITKYNLDPDKGGMTRPEIQRNASTIIVAGSETTSNNLAGTVWFLTQYPRHYQRLRDDIRANFSSAGEISIQRIIDRLPFLQAVVNESFRLYPPAVAGQPRVAPKGGDTVSGHFIPEGTGIQLNQLAANHSHLNFDEPEIFAPERWMDSEKHERWKNDQLKVVQPFSVGARNCIGRYLALAEIRLILTHLLYRFDIEPCDETDKHWTAQKAWLVWEKKPMIVKLSNRAQ